jgi:hypothetical protein
VRSDGRLALVGRFTEGSEPADHHAARAFLFDLAGRFDSAGLPTWQIDPRQPRSLGNLLETAPGEYTVIDLESGMVSPMASPRAWWRAFRRARIPIYDDVYFDVTRHYLAAHEAEMRERMGETWLAGLRAQVDAAQRASDAWHAAEPRAWSAAARFVLAWFGTRWLLRWLGAKRAQGLDVADRWMDASIDRWEADGRYTPAEAERTRAQLHDPGVQAVLPHFGVLLLFAARRTDRHAFRRSLGIHSPLVVVIAALPGFGTFAYLASGPVLRNHRIWRVAVDTVGEKLPLQVYRRTGARRIIAGPDRRPVATTARET